MKGEELYSGQGNRPTNLSRVLTTEEKIDYARELTTEVQMMGTFYAMGLEKGGSKLPKNRGNGGRGGGVEHAQVQDRITRIAGGEQEVRVYESGPGSLYRIVDNLDATGRYHEVGNMRYRGQNYRPSADQRGKIEDLRQVIGPDKTIIFHDKLGKGPKLINPDLQPNWRPAPQAYRIFGDGP